MIQSSQINVKTASSRSVSKGPPVRTANRLLAALGRDESERLLPKWELVRLPKNRILYEAGDTMAHSYFPNGGMASLLAINDDGQTIEIGTVGSEGFIGVPIIHESAGYALSSHGANANDCNKDGSRLVNH